MLIEDGTGLATADTYVDISFVDAYHTKLLNTAWTDLTDNAVKEAYIYKAMNYIEAVYGQNWLGVPLNSTQGLTMPRLYDGLTLYPIALQNAACELALESLNLDGEPLMVNTSQRITEEKVDVITTKFSEYSSEQTQFTTVYQLLSPYLESSSSYSHRVSR